MIAILTNLSLRFITPFSIKRLAGPTNGCILVSMYQNATGCKLYRLNACQSIHTGREAIDKPLYQGLADVYQFTTKMPDLRFSLELRIRVTKSYFFTRVLQP